MREKRCTKCGEYWPADLEFFSRKQNGLHSWCRACLREANDAIKRKKYRIPCDTQLPGLRG
jgi:hypothetical protein